ncbi:uridine kinase family protein [Streptomyces litchfieldiae]|uniref:Uridine kinase n=1 Tax=Streptomyces litchfieldiae TaxID=3075543 RepID=A0ABU2MUP3_9ACTN|nr:hypothetical protein [Streptomyces sp. DSM 44938]MDT0345365.1 hypothetical protein [Streptomyces sp. DSM 44938]
MTPTVVETFAALAADIQTGPPRLGPVRLVAVDGPGGAGKSTFAARLAAAFDGGVPVLHTDDFASWDGTEDWWPRLEEQVLRPLGAGRPGRYQRYDWERRELAEWHDVPVTDVVVLEGVSASRLAVADRLTHAIWIDTDPATRLGRGLLRDGEDALPLWREWMAEEDRHFAYDRAHERAGLTVDGAPALPHDPDREYVRRAPAHPGGGLS